MKNNDAITTHCLCWNINLLKKHVGKIIQVWIHIPTETRAFPNGPVTQIPHCISPVSYNAPFCKRNVHICAHFFYKMVHCGVFAALWDLWDGSFVHPSLSTTIITSNDTAITPRFDVIISLLLRQIYDSRRHTQTHIEFRAWIRNHIHTKLWDIITRPLLNSRLAKPPWKLWHGWVITYRRKAWF